MAHTAVTEPPWLTARRSRAVDCVNRLELPHFKGVAGWEFNDISGLDLDAYHAAPAGATDVWVEPLFAELDGLALKQVDAASQSEALPDSLGEPVVMPLDAAAERFPDVVARHFGTAVSSDDPFVARNEDGWSGGAFVYVPRGQRLDAAAITAL